MMLLWLSTKEIAGNCDSYICLEFLWLLSLDISGFYNLLSDLC